MQAGAVHALEDDDWIFPSYRESAIGLLRGMPAATILSWWRGHPAGWWNPADYNVASICVPIATQVPPPPGSPGGSGCGGDRVRATFFGDGADLGGCLPRGCELRRRDAGALVLPLQQQPVGDLDTAVRADPGRGSGDKAAGYGIPGTRVDGGDVLAVYEAVRDGVARARAGGGPTFIEAVTSRAAPHATADDPKAYIDLERVEEERANECVGRPAGYLRRQECCTTPSTSRSRREAADGMRTGIAAAEAEPPADIGLLLEHALADPPPRSRTTSRSCGGCSVGELLLVEAERRALHHGDGARSERAGRGRRPRGRRLPRDRRTSRPLRRRPVRRHPLAEAGILGSAVGLRMAGYRPVREMQYDAFSYPCLDQLITARRPLPLAHGRHDDLSDHDPDALRRRRPGARAARRLAGDVLRAHAVDQGRDPSTRVDAKGLLAAAIRDPDPVVILEPASPIDRARRGARGRARRPARQGSACAGGHGRHAVAYGAMVPVCERAADELTRPSRCSTALAEAARRGGAARFRREDRPRRARPGGAAHVGYAAELAAILAEKALLDRRRRSSASPATTCRIRTGSSRMPICPRSRVVDAARRRSSSSGAFHEPPLDAAVLHGRFSREP